MERLLRIEEAADALGCRRSFFYRLIAAGEIETVTIGRLRRVPSSALAEFIESRRAMPDTDTAGTAGGQ